MLFGINHNLMAMNVSRNLGNHYQELGVSTRRLSSGLRIGTAADDAAGLAVRELMRSDVSTLNQGVRNANDAISMIQTADGALEVIDEKLIRMKELAEQAATGTYTSDQRMIIDSEFQAMASEIQRIASATDFNGIKLLDGHFGMSVNNLEQINVDGFGLGASNYISREVVEINGSIYSGDWYGNVWRYSEGTSWDLVNSGAGHFVYDFNDKLVTTQPSAAGIKINMMNGDGTFSQINSDGFGSANNFGNDGFAEVSNKMYMSTHNGVDGTQIFRYDGGNAWTQINESGFGSAQNDNSYLYNYNGSLIATTWNVSGAQIYKYEENGSWQKIAENGIGASYDTVRMANLNDNLYAIASGAVGTRVFRYDGGMTWTPISSQGFGDPGNTKGFLTVFNNTLYASTGGENVGDIAKIYQYDGKDQWSVVNSDGMGSANNQYCMLSATDDTLYVTTYNTTDGCRIYTLLSKNSDDMEIQFGKGNTENIDNYKVLLQDSGVSSRGLDLIDYDLRTEANAQRSLVGLDYSIKQKDKIRANLGATQNRLENTISNLQIQAENLQDAESQISDVDVADEMTNFVKEQILSQAATAMLAQANSIPKMAIQLISGG